MKVVIDIPDGYVGVIMSNQRMEGSAMDKLIRQAIINGTPYEERPQGEWVKLYHENPYACDDYGRSYVKCSICGQTHGTDDSDFCPNCGADMRGEKK